MSFLDQSYLGSTVVDPRPPTPAAVLQPSDERLPAPAEGLAGDEMIQLPMGIVIPKKILMIAAIIAAAYVVYKITDKNKD